MTSWTDKTVMITGASSGIGKGLALALAARGAKLGLLARRQDLLDATVNEIKAGKGVALAVTADVRDARAVRAAVDRVRAEFGPIDIMIANAGIGTAKHAAQLDPEQFAEVMNINVLGAVNSVAAEVTEMVERKSGRLVAIASLAGYRGLAKAAAYCARKAALPSFFESLRLGLRGPGAEV